MASVSCLLVGEAAPAVRQDVGAIANKYARQPWAMLARDEPNAWARHPMAQRTKSPRILAV